MNKTEIRARIDALQADFDSKLSSLKADLAKCDCEDKAQAGGIEQEMCWHRLVNSISVWSTNPGKKNEVDLFCKDRIGRPAYMPECRQVGPEDARIAEELAFLYEGDTNEFAYELHKRGFRMKVNP